MSGRILIVDDDEALQAMVKDLLSTEGYDILEASDGRRALDRAIGERPDLILLDWNLPEMDGLDVCRAIRAHEDEAVRTTLVVMLTAMNTPDDTHTAYAAGVDDFLTKPFKPGVLLGRVADWIAKRAQPAG